MSYKIEAATKEEWAERALSGEKKLEELKAACIAAWGAAARAAYGVGVDASDAAAYAAAWEAAHDAYQDELNKTKEQTNE